MNRLDQLIEEKRRARAAAESGDRFATVIQARTEPILAHVAPPKNKLEMLMQEAKARPLSSMHGQEMQRILSLPVIMPMTPEEISAFSKEHVLAKAYAEGFRFFPTQAQALHEYMLFGGLLGPIGVGWGKTLISLMIAEHAYTKERIKKILLLIPPEIVTQFTRDVRWARTKVPLSVPIHVMGGKSRDRRQILAKSKKTGLYVLPYSLLSTTDTDENLADIVPGLIIADEAHKISRAHAARTKRVRRYLSSHPDVKMVALSGTITSKSVRDYWHLAKASLKQNNPLPNILEMANEWADKIDSTAASDGKAGPLRLLVDWAKKEFPSQTVENTLTGFRAAYRQRLMTAPGVVSSGEADIGTSLLFSERGLRLEGSPGSETLTSLMDDVQHTWKTPNGDEIDFAMHSWKWLFELTAGFYNELYWPSVEEIARRRGCSVAQAQDTLAKSQDWFVAGQAYAKVLREFLTLGRPGLDTPMAVGSFLHHHGPACAPRVPLEVYEAWQAQRDLDFPDRIERDSRAVRVCDYKVRDAIAWAKQLPKGKGGIIWAFHIEMAQWLAEEVEKAGLPLLFAPAGANDEITDPANAYRVAVASITAHHTGKNLQHFQHQLMVQWPRPANMAEQMLGRLHRNGQTADEIVAEQQMANEWDDFNFAACLNDALYIHQTTGNRQKMIYGTYTYPPKIFSPEKLRAIGLDAKILTTEQRELMRERFGDFE